MSVPVEFPPSAPSVVVSPAIVFPLVAPSPDPVPAVVAGLGALVVAAAVVVSVTVVDDWATPKKKALC